MTSSANRSEVAHLIWSIQRSCEAMQRVMNDPGFSASHQEINRRYRALGNLEDRLAQYIGAQEATDVMCDIYSHVMSQEHHDSLHSKGVDGST
jgi:predicted translin family RNA/ssDNA-binding protein